MLPSILTIFLFTFIPFIIVLANSFIVNTGFHADEIRPGFDNYKRIFELDMYKVGVRNSIIYAMTALPISLVISILVSVAITQIVKKWARGFWQTIFFLPYVTSAVAVSLSFFYLFKTSDSTGPGILNLTLKSLGLIKEDIRFLDSGDIHSWKPLLVILIRGVWGNLAFQILILTTAMLSVDQQLYKAAAIDGASKGKQFFSVTLPSIRKTVSFLVTMGLINGIKVFPLALFNNDPNAAALNGGSSLMLMVYKFVNEGNFALAGAASITLFVIGVVVSYSLRKIVALTFKASLKIGEMNVLNKIESTSFKPKSLFKI